MSGCLSNVARPITCPARSERNSHGACARFHLGLTPAGTDEGGKVNENTPPPERRVRQGMDYGETEDVQQVHAAIQREKREPHAGLEPLSIWLIAIYGLTIFFGGAYLGRFSGTFSGDSLDPILIPSAKKTAAGGPGAGQQAAELSPAERGKKIFLANCATCHQANGLGVPGQYPPLAGSEFTTG